MPDKKATAIIIERPRKAVVREIRLPEVDESSIVIRTTYSGISTGTELKVWSGKSGSFKGTLWYPLVPGYEPVGVVEYVGSKAPNTATGEKLQVSDRVMANEVRWYPDYCSAWGGQVGIAVKNSKTAGGCSDMPAKIPDGVSDQEAVVCYLAAVAKKGIDKVGINAGETVLVIGAGTIGLSAIQLAKLRGAHVIAVDISSWRLERAKKVADAVICADAANAVEPLANLTDGKLADVVFETSGNPAVVNVCCQLVREGGWDRDDDGARIHLQGDYPDPIILTPYQDWFNHNLRISMTCAIKPGNKEDILKLVQEKKFDADLLWDKEVTLDQAPAAYEELDRNRANRLKTLIRWENQIRKEKGGDVL